MTTPTPFVVIMVAVVLIHFLAVNLLTPKLVGHRVKLNPLAVTVALMFWGWLWGAVGLIIAIPLTAAIKAVCDNVKGLKPFDNFGRRVVKYTSLRLKKSEGQSQSARISATHCFNEGQS